MRIAIPSGGASIKIIDSAKYGGRVGFSIQNVGAVDIFYSDSQRDLDSVGAANLPINGHVLSAAPAPPLPAPLVYPWFVGQLFARAQNNGALLEIVIYSVDKC